MLTNGIETNLEYTPRQIQSAFRPQPPAELPQTETNPPLPLNMDMPSGAVEQQEIVRSESPQQQQQIIRPDAPTFIPSSESNGTKSETPQSSAHIYDLKKYKYDYFISKLSCSSDQQSAEFGSPKGICALNNDRLLVANFERDSVLLLDIQGTVYQIYKDLPGPKDVLYETSNPSHAVVATRKEMIILDVETKQIVARSKTRGFYPWNIQYIQERDTFAACDPSGERIVFFDKNLSETGSWSFSSQVPGQAEGYQKLYPYAAHFFPDDTSLVLINRGNKCYLREFDMISRQERKVYSPLSSSQSYSIYADSERKFLIPDKDNRRLISVSQDSTIEEYKSKFMQEPYSMTFLSTGTMCVTDWNQSFGTRGGIIVISEMDLKNNQ